MTHLHIPTSVALLKSSHTMCEMCVGILDRHKWLQTAHPFAREDVVAFKTSPCFVDHLSEMFGPLLSGRHLHVYAVLVLSASVSPC